MKRFLKLLLIFVSPFIPLGLGVAYIDPFNVFSEEENVEMKAIKDEISLKINYPLYALQNFYYNPTNTIVLGDSRAHHLHKENFDSLGNESITNLAYGGGTIQEIVETFWAATEIHALKKVYVGINFNLYNDLNVRNRVNEANALRESYLSYVLSKYAIKSSYYILESLMTGEKVNMEKPPFSKEEFWKYQLKTAGESFFQNYSYPKKYHKQLNEIVAYCKEQNIELVLFIPPTHTDLQSQISINNLDQERIQFKKDLSAFNVRVIDFNFKNRLTENDQNFGDPFHFDDAYEKIIIETLSTQKGIAIKHQGLFKEIGSKN